MTLFDPNIFDAFIFGTPVTSSTTETSVVERKRSRGRTRSFLKFDTKKVRKLFNSYESKKEMTVRAFKPAATRQQLVVESVHLDELDADSMMSEAKEQIISAASKAADIRTLTKTVQVVSMKPKKIRMTADAHTLITQARELIESAHLLIEKPSLYPGSEPSLYGDVPVYFYGEVEFQIDNRVHKEPDECDDYNGQVFTYGPDGLEDGAPNPPLHPNCACVLRETKTGATMWFPGSDWEGY